MDENHNKAVKVLRDGGIVIFPTDTAFGIGCRIDYEEAVLRLFEIRKRSQDKAVPVLCSSIEMVEEYVEPFDLDVRNLMGKYWPGALTLVLLAKVSKVPSLVRGGGVTVGIRIPDHNSTARIIRGVGVPILGTSANFASEKTPFDFSELDPELVKQVDFVLEGECKSKEASTVLDVSVKPWKVLRQGAVYLEI